MNIKLTLHNAVTITLVAAIGILAFRLASKTQLAQVPLLGDAVRTVAGA